MSLQSSDVRAKVNGDLVTVEWHTFRDVPLTEMLRSIPVGAEVQYAEVKVTRPSTPGEIQQRRTEQRDARLSKETAERETLRRLKAKYE